MAYQRKTKDEYHVQGDYGYGCGYETECTESTLKEAKQRLKEYSQNAPQGTHRIIKKRIPINR